LTSAAGAGGVAFDRSHTDDLIAYLQASPSPYHAVASAAQRLEKVGFRQVEETASWEGTAGGRYVIRGGALIAWYYAMFGRLPITRLIIMNVPHPALAEKGLRTFRQLKKSWYIFFFQLPKIPEWALARKGCEAIGRRVERGDHEVEFASLKKV